MAIIQTEFPGLFIYEPTVLKDSRGYFFESYSERLFQEAGINARFVQDNQSKSIYGVIRGLHYQLHPHAQTKLVRVVNGSIMDVAVDIRTGSPTYGRAFCIELSSENNKQLLIPKGFAHGFSVLSETAEAMYKCDGFYNKESEAGIIYNDATLNINWQIPADKVIISEKDLQQPSFMNCKNNFLFEQ
jgi:dTDP-4-dehydrorhamnose 3,5-epimerase